MKKLIKKWISYFRYNFSFLLILFSPFKGLKLKFYFGEIAIGTPYFLPRKWIKVNKKDCEELLAKDLERNSRIEGRTWEFYKKYKKPVPVKWFHWHFTTLGWKTKFDEFRHEWNPMISIVILKKQFVIFILPNVDNNRHDTYWEAWLNYHYTTDNKLSMSKRLIQLFNNYSCTWLRWSGGNEVKTDYYYEILKPKYLKLYELWKHNK